MTDLLKSIGIGGSLADPAALLKQKAVDEQIKSLKAQFKSLVNAIDLSAKTGQLLGVPQSYVDKLVSLKDKAQGYVDATNVNPTELYNKLKGLDDEYRGLLAQQEKKVDETRMKKAREALDAVRARVREVEADTTTSKGLREDFQTLLVDAEDLVKKLEAALEAGREVQEAAARTAEGFEDGGGAGGAEGIAAALFPKIPLSDSFFQSSPDSILDRLRILNLKKEAEEEKEFNAARAIKRFFEYSKRIFWYGSLVFGALVGGIILSNFYVDEPFWAIKIFYFVVGAAIFPFVLLLGLIAPPFWHATLIPLSKVTLGAPAAPAAKDLQTGGGDQQPAASEPPPVYSLGLFQYEDVTQAAIDLRLKPTHSKIRALSGIVLGLTGGMMYWNDSFKYLAQG